MIIKLQKMVPFREASTIGTQIILLRIMQSHLRRKGVEDFKVVGGMDLFGNISKGAKYIEVGRHDFSNIYDDFIKYYGINIDELVSFGVKQYFDDIEFYPKAEMSLIFLYSETLGSQTLSQYNWHITPKMVSESIRRRIFYYQRDNINFLDRDFFANRAKSLLLLNMLSDMGCPKIRAELNIEASIFCKDADSLAVFDRILFRMTSEVFIKVHKELIDLINVYNGIKLSIEPLYEDSRAVKKRIKMIFCANPALYKSVVFSRSYKYDKLLASRKMISLIEDCESVS